jgi:hypothetical protein
MDVDNTFGEKITVVCGAMRWREQDSEFLFDPWLDGAHINKTRTPRSYGFDHYDWMLIDCVPAETNN